MFLVQLVLNLSFAVLIFLNLSGGWYEPELLLSDEDRFFQQKQTRPALSSAIGQLPAWESFNVWQCFSSQDLEIKSLRHFGDPLNKSEFVGESPSILIDYGENGFVFDYEEAFSANSSPADIIIEWKRLVEGEDDVCIYAAYLQDTGDGTSSWIVSGIKTGKGYWPPEKEKFFSTSFIDETAEGAEVSL